MCLFSLQLVAGFPGRDFGYKPYHARVSVDTRELAGIQLLWRSVGEKPAAGRDTKV
jgi:hypothetical protein